MIGVGRVIREVLDVTTRSEDELVGTADELGGLETFSAGSRLIQADSRRVLITGSFPINSEDLVTLIPVAWEPCVVDEGQPADFIGEIALAIIGQEDFSRDALLQLIGSGQGTRFLPQEAFVDQLLFGHDWWTTPPKWLDAVASYHDGLAFVAENRGGLGPQVRQGSPSTGELANRLNARSFLRELGYSVASDGPSELERRRCLRVAVGLRGYDAVDWYLRGFIELNTLRADPPVVAIRKWRSDLEWLGDEFD